MESVKAVGVGGSIGNLMKALSVSSGVDVKDNALFLVPTRYLMTLLAALMYPWVGLLEYLARRLVAVAMSGRVDILSKLREPMRDWKCLVSWFLSLVVVGLLIVDVIGLMRLVVLIKSIGYPLLYGGDRTVDELCVEIFLFC